MRANGLRRPINANTCTPTSNSGRRFQFGAHILFAIVELATFPISGGGGRGLRRRASLVVSVSSRKLAGLVANKWPLSSRALQKADKRER